MEKRLIGAIALSIAVIVVYQFLFAPQKSVVTVNERPLATPVRETRVIPGETTEVPAPAAAPAAAEKETIVETERYVITFSNVGGSIKDIALKEHSDRETGEPHLLVSDATGEAGIGAMKSNALMKDLDTSAFTLEKKERDRLVYALKVPGKFTLRKEYTFHNSNDYIVLRIFITNTSDSLLQRDYDLTAGSSIKPSGLAMGRRFMEITSMVDGKTSKRTSVRGGEILTKGIVSWTGVKERYFSILMKPQQEAEGVIARQLGKSNLASGIRTQRTPIYPGESVEDSYIIYIGPNSIVRLKQLELGLEHSVTYGIFGGISKFLLMILRKFHSITHNWGVSIILLTILINIILLPLTRKSFNSMKKIQEVQPHIEKLRNVHKDNPQKLNKELAELYRQYNVNPFGGCLPLFLQMPIFIALYQGLIRSIELKGANFLWIKDLSSPDYVRIPFSLPFLGNEIHILPILMVGAMFAQQWISTQHTAATSPEQKQQQRIMLIFFPLFFGFLFYKFPAGLVLYWLTNTILMLIEHTAMRRAGTK